LRVIYVEEFLTASLAASCRNKVAAAKTRSAYLDENSRFARRIKPCARSYAAEAVDYFTAFAFVPRDSQRIGRPRMCAERDLFAAPALLDWRWSKMTSRNLC
jgi:hypothetical protein